MQPYCLVDREQGARRIGQPGIRVGRCSKQRQKTTWSVHQYNPDEPLFSRDFRMRMRCFLTASLLAALTVLPGCDRPGEPDARHAPAPGGKAETGSAPALLAQWNSYSFQPPHYAYETIRMFDDGRCEVGASSGETVPACRWNSDGKGALEISVGASDHQLRTLQGILQGSMLDDAQDRTTGRYLQVDLGEGHNQVFVMADTDDAALVQTAIEAEQAWNTGHYARAVDKFRHAADQGNLYARMRLGWILATARAFRDPPAALAMLEPLGQHENYNVVSALAAAHAANGDFAAAVQQATRACEMARSDPPNFEQCTKRLALFRDGKPYLMPIAPDGG
jgi:hypothetical protein